MKRVSALVLILANVVPLYGVLVWGWDVRQLVVLYWLESVVIGAMAVVKILAAQGQATRGQLEFNMNLHLGQKTKWVIAPFFMCHYGFFMAVYATMLPALLKTDLGSLVGPALLPLAVLAASHGFSLLVNYFGRGEYKRTAAQISIEPYKRVFVMHVMIIGGSFLTLQFGGGLAIYAVLLIAAKTIIDVSSHLHEHDGVIRPGSHQPTLIHPNASARSARSKL